MLGPAGFGLDLKASVLVIVLFNAVMCVPPAWLATNGPRTGMRQMVQARYALGYVPAMLIGLANCTTFIGFLSLMSILGGQCLSIASEDKMTWTVGIVVVAIIGVIVGQNAVYVLTTSSRSSESALSTFSRSLPCQSYSSFTLCSSVSTAASSTMRWTPLPRSRQRSHPQESWVTVRVRLDSPSPILACRVTL